MISLLLGSKQVAFAQSNDILVIANPAGVARSLSRNEIRQVFMGGTLSRKYEAVTLPVANSVRIKFNTKVIGLTESRIQSYWAQLLFSGRSKPPTEMRNVDQVLQYVATVENAIGYVPSDTVIPENVIVVYQR